MYKHFREKDYGNPASLDNEILEYWEKNSIMAKSIEADETKESFTFYEGPPTANGKPGVHHILGRTIKDLFCRYKTMCGFSVDRRAGWDTHGLPVELEVEKELGLSSREAIHEFGIANYNEACKNSVLKYTKLWNDLTVKMGYWVDLENPYVTFDNNYIESLWWLIKTLHEKDLLYLGYKIHWYSPGTQTVLSSHEVSLGYKDVQDPSLTVKFALEGQENSYFLAWTTTPWTLISNAALAVGPNIEYVKIAVNDEFLFLAKDRLEIITDEYEVVETFMGSDLAGTRYKPLYDTFTSHEDANKLWKLITADYVSVSDGTGIVHIAPAFGGDDYEAAKKNDIPMLNPVKPNGCFDDSLELVGGLWFKDANKIIIKDLKEKGIVFDHKTLMHSYPHDWRKGTPLMNYPVKSWFVRTTRFKQRLVDFNNTINWQPENVGRGRFGEWLKNNVDWALSRHRFWGTPLPIWVNDQNPEDFVVIGSISELKEHAGDNIPSDEDLDLHRPYIDDITWESPNGGTMRRTPEIIDVWFDSGAMPFAQWHYPFENKEIFERNFPADFIAEGVDQTRGWFYTLHALASLVMDSVAYKNVVVNGLLLDDKGDKMSKSKGNTVDPFNALDTHGADAVRWYLMSVNPPWEDTRYSDKGIVEIRRKLFSTIENIYSFFTTYINIDKTNLSEQHIPVEKRRELDQWIISRLNNTAKACRSALDSYNPTEACKSIEKFVDELSNWYLRRSRNVFWSTRNVSDESTDDKLSAYITTRECLNSCARLIAPIAPFYSEWLYVAITQGEAESVHLASYPECNEKHVAPQVEEKMTLARNIASTTLALRNKADINVRQPLNQILVVADTQEQIAMVNAVSDIVQAETNIDKIECIPTSSDIVQRSAKINFKLLGKRLGRKMKVVSAAITKLSDEQIIHYIENGEISLQIDGEDYHFGKDEIEVQSKGIDGWIVESNASVTVALDVEIGSELKQRGLSREVVNRIQNMRKTLALNVENRINVKYATSSEIAEAIEVHKAYICSETLALSIVPYNRKEDDSGTEFQLDNETLTLVITKND